MMDGINSMVDVLMAWITCSKPTVAVVQGGAHGIGFTTLAHMDFIYCTPDAYMQTPFMKSFQSPEGGSMLTFPQQLGYRRAREVILLDKPLMAEEAVSCGFANGILNDLGASEWFDVSKVPAITKMLDTDYRTLVNAKKQFIMARDLVKIKEVIVKEGQALVAAWVDEEFPMKVMLFM